MLSLPLTFLILLVALGALVAAGVPLVLALTGVLAAMAMVVIPSQIFPMDGNVDALILLIGLAVGVDYSLFYMRREREERARGRARRSLMAAAATSGRAVLISGLTVMIAMSGMFITGEATFESFAVATVTVVAVELFVSLLVLPAVLAWLGDRVDKGRPASAQAVRAARRASRGSGARSCAASCAGRCSPRCCQPGCCIALAIPALGMKTVQTGTDDLPPDLAVMKTYDRYTTAFPDKTNINEVVVEGRRRPQRRCAGAIDELVATAAASDTFIGPADITYSDDGTVASVRLPSRGNGTDETSVAALEELREELVPATFGSVAGVDANVTGGASPSEDFNDVLSDGCPWCSCSCSASRSC